jgi:hypothetical protein
MKPAAMIAWFTFYYIYIYIYIYLFIYIQMDLLEIGWGGVDWIDLAQDRDKWRALVNVVMNLRAP